MLPVERPSARAWGQLTPTLPLILASSISVLHPTTTARTSRRESLLLSSSNPTLMPSLLRSLRTLHERPIRTTANLLLI